MLKKMREQRSFFLVLGNRELDRGGCVGSFQRKTRQGQAWSETREAEEVSGEM
jgi:hypothetical protein